MAGNLIALSVEELARAIASGELRASDVVAEYLARIARRDPELSSFVEVFARRARATASAVDRRTRGFAPDQTRTFAGVPIAIKDLNAVRGTRMRMGSRAFKYLLTPTDDRVVARLRAAGFIMLGKTSTPELGILPVTEPAVHPPTRNPWDPRHTPGGSSGGSAAAVAAGLAPIALGSDAGGSIRIPSSFCGLVGFKPSRGVVPNPFGLDAPELIWTCGPVVRSVSDAALAMHALTDTPPFASTAALTAAAMALPRLKVRWTTESAILAAEPEVASAVERVVQLVRSFGHEVEHGAPLSGTTLEEFLPLWQKNATTAPVLSWEYTEPFTQWLAAAGRKRSAEDIAALTRRIASSFADWFGAADIWLTPTVAVTAPLIGSLSNLSHEATFEGSARLAAFTAPFNVTGQPALSVPVALSSSGLPIGLQIAGKAGTDATVLALAQRLESELHWQHSALGL